ncbi:MAG: hypothetical protein CL933_06175 [Deltaproteobacteria bacterium]|nr:hypothetical protein [Deltaproteobacteria bacterium]
MPKRFFQTAHALRSPHLPVGSWIAIAAVLICAGAAGAHGQTIEISHHEMKPTRLNLFVGTTVHFLNTVAMGGGHVVVDAGGTIKSPPLAKPGDEWHYTFDEEGEFEIFIAQHPKAKARIRVVPK